MLLFSKRAGLIVVYGGYSIHMYKKYIGMYVHSFYTRTSMLDKSEAFFQLISTLFCVEKRGLYVHIPL
jgi:hypothetical protein